MKALECKERHGNQPTKRAVVPLWDVCVARKFMFCFLSIICILVQIGCHPAVDYSAGKVSERTEKNLGASKMDVLELPGYESHKSPCVGSLIFTDNRHLCSTGDELFKMFDVCANKKEINSFHIDGLGSDMYLLPQTKVLIVAGTANLEYMQDFDKSPRIKDSLVFRPFIFVTFSNGTAVFNDYDNGILLVDVISKQTRIIPPPDGDINGINTAAYSPKGKFLIAGGAVGVLRRWDLGDKHTTVRYNRQVGQPTPDFPKGRPIFRLAVSPDGANIAVAANDKVIRLLNAADGSVVKKLSIDSDGVDQHLLYSNDGKMLISIEPTGHNCQPSLIRFWDVKKGVEICAPYVGHKSRIISCCLSPDNSLLATGSYDGSILVWKVPSLTLKKEQKEEGNP